MKPKHQRLIFVCFSVALLTAAVLLTMRAFRENLIFFYSPSELAGVLPDQRIRIGGLVESGSVKKSADEQVEFTLSDGKAAIRVQYKGLLPNLFREGQGVIAEGYVQDAGHFSAQTILAKHDETYMPKEVVDALKRTGHWHER